jgi:hypothetical protein
VTAIHGADGDGNDDTAADESWTPLIPTPPFPAYTSGHSTFSAAAAAVLEDFFGGDEFAFTLESETPDAADRSFTSFSEAANESGLSRIYGGIHWSFDNEAGLAAGDAVGDFVSENLLGPLSPPSSLLASTAVYVSAAHGELASLAPPTVSALGAKETRRPTIRTHVPAVADARIAHGSKEELSGYEQLRKSGAAKSSLGDLDTLFAELGRKGFSRLGVA